MTDEDAPQTTESKKPRPARKVPKPEEPAPAAPRTEAADIEEPPPKSSPQPRRSPEPWHTDETAEPTSSERTSRLYRLGRKLLDRGDDVRELASTFLETGDRAKTEAVRMMAREVRNYLEELKLKESILDLMRSHSLELKISVHLKPLADAVESDAASKKGSRSETDPPG